MAVLIENAIKVSMLWFFLYSNNVFLTPPPPQKKGKWFNITTQTKVLMLDKLKVNLSIKDWLSSEIKSIQTQHRIYLYARESNMNAWNSAADFRTLVVDVVAHVVSAIKLQTRVLVSTIQGHHWSGGGGWSRCPSWSHRQPTVLRPPWGGNARYRFDYRISFGLTWKVS